MPNQPGPDSQNSEEGGQAIVCPNQMPFGANRECTEPSGTRLTLSPCAYGIYAPGLMPAARQGDSCVHWAALGASPCSPCSGDTALCCLFSQAVPGSRLGAHPADIGLVKKISVIRDLIICSAQAPKAAHRFSTHSKGEGTRGVTVIDMKHTGKQCSLSSATG